MSALNPKIWQNIFCNDNFLYVQNNITGNNKFSKKNETKSKRNVYLCRMFVCVIIITMSAAVNVKTSKHFNPFIPRVQGKIRVTKIKLSLIILHNLCLIVYNLCFNNIIGM